MAHYAFLDEHNVVTEVITGKDETEPIEGLDTETWYGNFRGQRCVRTSYNGNIRKQYAGVGYTYDEVSDEFVQPKPFLSWILNSNNDWEPPVPRPQGYVEWSEETLSWELTDSEIPDNFID
jgi:hypothetical protein